jgi:hypothetical protein
MQLHKTFTDRSTQLGNLFAAAENTELSNKMALYTMDQKACYQNLSLFWWFFYIATEK